MLTYMNSRCIQCMHTIFLQLITITITFAIAYFAHIGWYFGT